MTTTTPWMSELATVTIGTALTVNSTQDLDTQQSGTAYTNEVRDFRLTGGERDVETVKELGYAESRNLKRSTVLTCTFTLVHRDKDFSGLFMGTPQTITGSYKRSQGGEKASNDRSSVSILIKLNDGTNVVHILLNNAYATSQEISLSADGFVEETMTFKCLAQDYYYEDNFG